MYGKLSGGSISPLFQVYQTQRLSERAFVKNYIRSVLYLLEDVSIRGVLQEPRKLRVRAGLLNTAKEMVEVQSRENRWGGGGE